MSEKLYDFEGSQKAREYIHGYAAGRSHGNSTEAHLRSQIESLRTALATAQAQVGAERNRVVQSFADYIAAELRIHGRAYGYIYDLAVKWLSREEAAQGEKGE